MVANQYYPAPMQGNMMPQVAQQYSNQAQGSLQGINGHSAFFGGYGQIETNVTGVRLSTPFTYAPLFNQPQIPFQDNGMFPIYAGGNGVPTGSPQGGGYPSVGGYPGVGGYPDPSGAFITPSFSPNSGGIPTSMMPLLNNAMGIPNFAGTGGYGGQGGGQAPAGAFAPSYQNVNSLQDEASRGIANRFAHYGFDSFGRMIGNFYDVMTNGIDKTFYRNRVVGPVDPGSLSGSGGVVNPMGAFFVSGIGPSSFAEANSEGAKAFGGGEAYVYSSRSPGGVLLDYDGPRKYFNYSPTINRFQNGIG